MRHLKKIRGMFILIGVTIIFSVLPVNASNGICVMVDGKAVNFDVAPQIINDRTMVPLRAIFEALGSTVEWNQETKTIKSEKNGVSIELIINSDKMLVDNKSVTLDAPPCIVDSRTLVPVRAISEAYDTEVNWDEETKTVSIITNKESEEDVKTDNLPVEIAVETPVYDDISVNIKQINNMINSGKYLEAIEECERTQSWHILSPEDIDLLNSLKNKAQSKYDEYLQQQRGSYYPGTNVPDYTSVTGISLKEYTEGDNGGIYVYPNTKSGEYSEMVDYIGYLRDNGWREYSNRSTSEKLSYTYITGYTADRGNMVGISFYPKYDEVWITVLH